MPVTTKIITVESGSARREKATLKSPDAIQLKTSSTTAADESAGARTTDQAVTAEARNDAIIAPQATALAAALLIRRPRLALTRKPMKGSSGISSSSIADFTTSAT